MADNVNIDPGATTPIATDDVGGVQYQRVKVVPGADGAAGVDLGGRDLGSSQGSAVYVDPRISVVQASVTPTISAGVAYAAKDAVGGWMEFTNAARVAGGSGRVEVVRIADKDAEKAELDLVLFDSDLSASSPATDNAVFDVADADLDNIVGWVPINGGDYADFNDNAHGTRMPGLPFILSGGTSLWGVLVARTTPTYTATTDLVVTLTILRD